MGTTATTIVVPDAPSGQRREFPRVGDWCVLEDKIGIVARLGYYSIAVVEEPNPAKPGAMQSVKKDVFDVSQPFAEVHIVDQAKGETHGETIGVRKNVAFEALRPATLDELKTFDRNNHVTALQARSLGYPLTDDQHKEADVQAQAERAQLELAARIAAHPDALALEQQIEEERLAFIASVEARRSAVAARIQAEPRV